MTKLLRAILAVFLTILAPLSCLEYPEKAVTYELSGRFGNRILTYLGAKWIAQQHQLPLIYVPFTHDRNFVFYEKESLKKPSFPPYARFQLEKNSNILGLPDKTLIFVNFFKTIDPQNRSKGRLALSPYLNNPDFRKWAKPLLQPSASFKKIATRIALPQDRLTVLVHVRDGGDYDSRKTQLRFPTKFPPPSFYIAALEKISEEFKSQPIFAYIMTDALQPEKIVEKYRQALAHLPHIDFGYRKESRGAEADLMEDFFSVPYFDCLIRANSTFTIAAALAGEFKATVFPKKCRVEKEEILCEELTLYRK